MANDSWRRGQNIEFQGEFGHEGPIAEQLTEGNSNFLGDPEVVSIPQIHNPTGGEGEFMSYNRKYTQSPGRLQVPPHLRQELDH